MKDDKFTIYIIIENLEMLLFHCIIKSWSLSLSLSLPPSLPPSLSLSLTCTHTQLFGGYQTVLERSQWTHGILTRHLSHITSAAHHNRVYTHPDRSASLPRPLPPYWIVLDGPLAPAVLESITALLSEGGLCVGNMERLVLPPSCLLLLKPVGVCPLQPALVGRSGFLYWGRNLVTSEVLVESWLEQAPTKHDLSTMR